LASMWQQWIERRFKIDQHKQLTQKDVLIFIYQQGYLYLVLIFITFIAGVNYANNLILGFCFLISAVLCISFYITFKQLHALQIQINVVDTPQAGELLSVEIYFKQDAEQARYLWIKTENQLHKLLFNTQQHGFQLNFTTSQRGVFQIPPYKFIVFIPLVWFGPGRICTYSNQRGLHLKPVCIPLKISNNSKTLNLILMNFANYGVFRRGIHFMRCLGNKQHEDKAYM
jgi:hypothetical protein